MIAIKVSCPKCEGQSMGMERKAYHRIDEHGEICEIYQYGEDEQYFCCDCGHEDKRSAFIQEG